MTSFFLGILIATATVVAYGAAWVYDAEPVSAGDAGLPGCTDEDPIPCDYYLVDPATARIFLPLRTLPKFQNLFRVNQNGKLKRMT